MEYSRVGSWHNQLSIGCCQKKLLSICLVVAQLYNLASGILVWVDLAGALCRHQHSLLRQLAVLLAGASLVAAPVVAVLYDRLWLPSMPQFQLLHFDKTHWKTLAGNTSRVEDWADSWVSILIFLPASLSAWLPPHSFSLFGFYLYRFPLLLW